MDDRTRSLLASLTPKELRALIAAVLDELAKVATKPAAEILA